MFQTKHQGISNYLFIFCNSFVMTYVGVGVSSNPHIYHDLLYVVPRVRVSRRTLQCRVRHLTPTYVMTNELQLLNYAINNLHLA